MTLFQTAFLSATRAMLDTQLEILPIVSVAIRLTCGLEPLLITREMLSTKAGWPQEIAMPLGFIQDVWRVVIAMDLACILNACIVENSTIRPN
jgi:hypothetical protein